MIMTTVYVLAIAAGAGLLVVLAAAVLYRKVDAGTALIRLGAGGPRVGFSGVWVFPLVHRVERMDLTTKRVEVVRRGADGLACGDGVLMDLVAVFYLAVPADAAGVLKVRSSLGCERAADPAALTELFAPELSEALARAARRFDFDHIDANREALKAAIVDALGDLRGFTLDRLALDHFERTERA